MSGKLDPARTDGTGRVLRVDIAEAPDRAFLSGALVERLLSIVDADADVHADAVTLESTAGAFCMGLDPGLLLLNDDDDGAGPRARLALEGFGRLLRSIESAPRPVIAIVDGAAAGGGVALAAAADCVIATHRATFGLPETLLGVVPALAFPVLARRIGVARARWMAISGNTIDAGAAYRFGLADIATDQPDTALARCLQRLTRVDTRAVAAIKALVARDDANPADYESAAVRTFTQLLGSPETQARIRRFVDGLAPWPEDRMP